MSVYRFTNICICLYCICKRKKKFKDTPLFFSEGFAREIHEQWSNQVRLCLWAALCMRGLVVVQVRPARVDLCDACACGRGGMSLEWAKKTSLQGSGARRAGQRRLFDGARGEDKSGCICVSRVHGRGGLDWWLGGWWVWWSSSSRVARRDDPPVCLGLGRPGSGRAPRIRRRDAVRCAPASQPS